MWQLTSRASRVKFPRTSLALAYDQLNGLTR